MPRKLAPNSTGNAFPLARGYHQLDRLDVEYEIERQGDVIIIRPVGPPLTDVLTRFSAFSADFMATGRPDQGVQTRDVL